MTEGEIEKIIERLNEMDEKHSARFTNIEGHLETINGSVMTLLGDVEDHKGELKDIGLWQARWEGGLAASKFAVPLIVGLAGAILGALIGRGL